MVRRCGARRDPSSNPMRIQSLSTLTGASQKAIRHYEALGLIGPVPRIGRYRDYGADHVALVGLIRRALRLGLRLADLRGARRPDASVDWPLLAAQVRRRQQQVQAERDRLATVAAELRAIERELQRCPQAAAPAPTAGPPACLAPLGR